MKNIFLVFVFAFCLFQANAQVTTLSSSQGLIPALPLKTLGGGYLALEKREDILSGSNWNKFRNSITVVQYDANMKRIKDLKLSEGKSSYSAHYSELKIIDGKSWLLYLEPASGNEVGNIMAVEIDPSTLALGTPKIIADKSAINLDMKFVGAISKTLRIFTTQSPGGNHQAIFVSTGKDDFYIGCLDSQMNMVWQRRESIEKVKDRDITSIAVDDKGKIYLGYTRKSDGFIGAYTKSGSPVHDQIPVEEHDVKDVLFISNSKTGAINVIGSYMDNDYCLGVYKATIGNNSKTGAFVLTPFPDDLRKQLDKENFAKSKKGLFQFYDAELFQLEDGSIAMVAEMQKTIYDNITRTMTGSVIVVRFDKNVSFGKVPKYNATGGEGRKQYHAQPCGNNILVFYNDNPDNLSRDITLDGKVLGKNIVFVAAQIKPDGSVERKQVNGYGANLTSAMQYLMQGCQ